MNQYEELLSSASARFPETIDLVNRYTKAAREIIDLTVVKDREALRIFRVVLFARIVSGMEAMSLLSKAGLATEADVIFRSNLEALFRLGALVHQPEIMVRYLGEDFRLRRQAMEDVRNMLKGCDPRPAGAVTEEQIDEALAKIDKEQTGFLKLHDLQKLSKVETWQWAQASQQLVIFQAKYLAHSNVAHHGSRDLERHFVLSEDGERIKSLNFQPDEQDPTELLVDALQILTSAIALFLQGEERELTDAHWALKDEMDRLFSKIHKTEL